MRPGPAPERWSRWSGSEHGWRIRLRYRVDQLFARGTGVVIAWLAFLTLAIVVAAAVLLTVAHVAVNRGGETGLHETFWVTLLRTLDPGTMATDAGWPFRVVSLLVTLAGIFLLSSLVGVIVAGVERRTERLRRGRSEVVEHGHTLILGWSPKVPTLVREIVEANRSTDGGCIVLMADRDVVTMEEELRARVRDHGQTKIVCRSGSPFDPDDLRLVGPEDARTIVVLRPEESTGDAQVVRGVLAVLSRPATDQVPILAELADVRRAESLGEVTGSQVRTVVSSEVIARLTAQACIYRGIGGVHEQLLGFAGSDIYLHSEPLAIGRSFGDAVLGFARSCPIGVVHGSGELDLAPPTDLMVRPGDRLVVVAEDDSTIGQLELDGAAEPASNSLRTRRVGPDRTLILGWSDLGPLVLEELDRFVAPGSSVHVAVVEEYVPAAVVRGSVELRNLELIACAIDAHEPRKLAQLIHANPFDHVVLLCYRTLDPAEADALNLMTLLELRHALTAQAPTSTRRRSRPGVVTELLDERDVQLAVTADADDFIVSERLTALLMAQVSEAPEIDDVWSELLDFDGAEIAIVPASEYGLSGDLRFQDIARSVMRLGDSAIGYRLARSAAVLSPSKSDRVTLGAEDDVVVVTRA